MFLTPRLATPGTTPLPPEVLAAVARPMIHHRSAEFTATLERVHHNLQRVFQTQNPVVLLTASGSGAGEAISSSLFTAGETVLYTSHGKFSERWGEMLRLRGVDTLDVTVPLGTAPTFQDISDVLGGRSRKTTEVAAVWLTQSETSTGVWTDVKEIAAQLRREHPDILIVVDAVSALMAHPMHMDEWQLDVVFGASQKGFMAPPGLAPVALSRRAVHKLQQVRPGSVYLDLKRALEAWRNNSTPFTPALSSINGLDAALQIILRDGLAASHTRHAAHSKAVRAAVQALNLKLFGSPPSHAATAVELPPNAAEFRRILVEEMRVTPAGGQGALSKKIFRIGHLGFQDAGDMLAIIAAIEMALLGSGHEVRPGAGLSAAQGVYCAAAGLQHDAKQKNHA